MGSKRSLCNSGCVFSFPVVSVMVEEINSDLDEGIDSVSDALNDDDPSDKLADLGNVRSRR